MVNRRRGVLIVGLAVVAAVASIALADVIFVYKGTINVQPMTTTPLVFSTGPNGNEQPYISFTVSPNYDSFTVTLVITDSSAVYYYEAGELTVNTPGYIYVSSVNPSYTATTAPVQSMTIYIQDTSGSIVCQLPVISGGSPDPPPPPSSPAPPSPSPCKLGAGTYYISIKVVPNLPVTSSSTETVTVTFGYNVISNAPVPVPT
jgi:hypothetical protein